MILATGDQDPTTGQHEELFAATFDKPYDHGSAIDTVRRLTSVQRGQDNAS